MAVQKYFLRGWDSGLQQWVTWNSTPNPVTNPLSSDTTPNYTGTLSSIRIESTILLGDDPVGNGRIAPDNDDLVVWYNYTGGGSWSAAKGGSACDLAIVSAGPYSALGPYGDGQFEPSPLLSTSQGGVGRSSATSTGESSAFTASAWIYLPAVPSSAPAPYPVVGKQDADTPWSPPSYASWHLSVFPGTGAPGTADLGAGIWLVGGAGVVPQASGVTPGLHLVGLTVDTASAKLYLDDALVAAVATGAAPDWFNHGPYFVGGIPISAYSRSYSACRVGDVRIARVARPLSYFQAAWATRRIP